MKLKFLLFTFLISLFSFGQKSKIEYYTFTKNTIDTTGIRSYLIFDNNKSLFVWRSEKQEEKSEIYDDDEDRVNFKKSFNDTIGTRVFNNYGKKFLVLNEPLMEKNFTVIDQKPKFNWKIKEEFKEISGIRCQKATTNFRGRKYIAWFTESIPSPTGPWKLGGLPGLIMEAHDEDSNVNFLFKSFTKNYSGKEKININLNKNNSLKIEEFVAKKDERFERIMKQQLAKLPKGTIISDSKRSKRLGLEIIYEWEMNK
ncbi:GLPGLI family protein [Aureivirga sp. CE67]|uniref:GLPGLI family protein n=1 Tax=Aureivirga sp. CE67 TaxID=1788983 RepID=UPI0018C8E972|nr:GLPGLI family protein [Aureivirga sp. CE67]